LLRMWPTKARACTFRLEHPGTGSPQVGTDPFAMR
jgi:hypothetical protein